MNKYNFLLSFFLLLLSGVSDFHESVTTMADEHSGDGMSLTVPTTEGSISSVLFSISTNKSEEQNATTPTETENTVIESTSPTEMNGNEPILHTAVIIGIAVALFLVLLIILVIFIVRRRKQKQSQEDELGSENGKRSISPSQQVLSSSPTISPLPIFEEDTPSVMEIEMEELDKWMNSLKKNESDYLPAVKEEKDCNTNPSSRSVLSLICLCASMEDYKSFLVRFPQMLR
ncbi:transmembrane protein 154 isoform X4 [Ahaetulla prasina]|uniref:transmembrane protein 154 isoform X4 n=1 Tax=Ahaetulla prasina TaxID=499056 RepID=UPI002647BAB1|nr:transmembrane protein 154 isoform X4 [Ahaetulla prasina]